MGPVPPAVYVYCATTTCLRDILAGMEEERVPVRVEQHPEGDLVELAYAAATASPLDVGIGVDAAGMVCVHHAKLPAASPAITAPAAHARRLGHNAARLVTRTALKTS